MSQSQSSAPIRALPSRFRLWFRFGVGLIYSAFLAAPVSAGTRSDFLLVLAAELCGFLVCGGLGLWWLTRWSNRKDARLGQFTVGFLLLVTVFVAMFCSVVRWIAVRAAIDWPGATAGQMFCVVALIGLFAALISVPFVLGMIEALLWAAVWLVRRPTVRCLLPQPRSREQAGDADSGGG